MKSLLIFCILSFQIFTLHSQVVKAIVVDAENRAPIPYANVVYGTHQGVITNDEGFFSFTIQKLPAQIKISSIGYETLETSSDKIQNDTLFLKPATIELKEVFLSDKNIDPREIIEKVKEGVPNNYLFDFSKKKVFFRRSNFSQVREFDMKVDESTIPGINQRLMDQIVAEMPKTSDSYQEVLAEIFGDYDNQKLRIIKAADLYNPKRTQSLDQLTEHLEILFRKNLKEKSYLKVRSGLFGVKVDEEELEEEFAEKDAQDKQKTPEEVEEENAKSRLNLQKETTTDINSLLHTMFWKEDITFNLFEKTRKYDFSIEGYTKIGESSVYIIHFQPKRNADFRGKIYVDVLDYGVHRIEYENVKPLSKFRLFGISTLEDIFRGKMIFIKNSDDKYSLKYIEREEGNMVGIDRPLTIIEKNRHVPGRNKQNELDLDLIMKFGEIEKLQLVVYETDPLSKADYNKVEPENKFFEYQKLRTYKPDFWEGYQIIEPNTAIRQFTASETE